MKKIIFCVLLSALYGCAAGERPELNNMPVDQLDSQTCLSELSDVNSDCAHSVEPQLN